MKKQLLALSLLAVSGLSAQDDVQAVQQSDTYNTYDTSSFCEPCCTPQPRKCINYEAYNPQFYDLQCDWGAFVTVDFLYWYSRETNLSFGSKFVALQNVGATTNNIAYPTEFLDFDAAWDPGVRVGLGWNMDCDGWDLYLNWTYYHASQSNSEAVNSDTIWPLAGESSLFNPWSNGAIAGATTANWKSIHGKWSLNFNQIDLELGRKYWISRCVNLRPFAGLRAGWTTTNFETHSINSNSQPVTYTTSAGDFINETETNIQDLQKSRNKYWGAGFTVGLQPNWLLGNFCGCGDFSIYGNLDGSLIWGKFRGKRSVRSTYTSCDFDASSTVPLPCELYSNDTGYISANQKLFQMVPILDLAIGLRWEQRWCCDRYYTAIDLGWEHHVWFNHATRNQYAGDAAVQGLFGSEVDFADTVFDFYTSTPSVVSDLTFGGLVLRVRFDF